MRSLLAIDAAGNACSAAVWREGALRAQRREVLARGQSERLLPLVEAAMAEAAQDFSHLDAIAVTLGPGGFTGVRIGLAAAEGLALAHDLPVIGLSSFAVAAAAIDPAERAGANLLLLLDAKRAEVYAEALDEREDRLLAPALIAPALLRERLTLGQGRWLLAGSAVGQALPALTGAGTITEATAPRQSEAAVLARLAAALPLPPPGVRPQPLYLREPDTTVPRAKGPRR